MKKTPFRTIILLVLFTLMFFSLNRADTINFNKNKLKETLKDMLVEKLTEKIFTGIVATEKKLRDATYFNEILDDFKYFGIDPRNTAFTTKTLEIYNKYKDAYEKDKALQKSKSEERKNYIRQMLRNDLENIILSSLDKSSQDIINDLSALLKEGQDKINNLNKAAKEVSASDINTDITDILQKYGFDGDWVFRFKELETNIKLIKQKYGDYYRAYSIISEGMKAKNPGKKIHALFILGSEFAGKIPVLGKFIELYFKVGLAYLDACNRLAKCIRSREQFCVGSGTHAQIEGLSEDLRSRMFRKKFPGGFTACPIGPAGIYRDIYKNMDQGQGNKIYFWRKSKKRYLEGNPRHQGVADVQEIIRWLRKNRYFKRTSSIEFVSRAYNRSPGFLKYKTDTEKLVKDIRQSILFIYNQLHLCGENKVKHLIMNRCGAGFIKYLLVQQNIEWPEIKRFPTYLKDEITNRLIYWKYIRGNRDFLYRLKNIKKNLDQIQPVEVNGYVRDPNGNARKNIKVWVSPTRNIFNIEGSCRRLVTNEFGVFGFYLLLEKNRSIELSLQARGQKDSSETKKLLVTANKQPVYTLTLIMKSEIEEKEGLIIEPKSINLKIGEHVTFSVYDMKPSGQKSDLSRLAKWEPSRQFTAQKKGKYSVTASFPKESPYAKKQVTASISVNKPIKFFKINPEEKTLKMNETVLFYATATYEDGTHGDITEEVNWKPDPRFTARSVGTFDISATYQGQTQKARIIVEEAHKEAEKDKKNETDTCAELEEKFYEALNAGNLVGAQMLLVTAFKCDFYSSAFATLQLATERREEQQIKTESKLDICRELNRKITTAVHKKDFLLAQSLVREAESSGCQIPGGIRKSIQNGFREKEEEKPSIQHRPVSQDLAGIWDTTGGIVINIKKTGVNTYSGILARNYGRKKFGIRIGEQVLRATRTGRNHYTVYIAYRIPKGKRWIKGSLTLQGNRAIAGRRRWKRIK